MGRLSEPPRATRSAAPQEADRAGFEPAVEVSPYAGLANRCLQPLGHLSCVFAIKNPLQCTRSVASAPSKCRRRVLRLTLLSPDTLTRRRHRCRLGLGRPDTGQLVLGRPCGPPAVGTAPPSRPTPRPAARTSQSRHANPTPASCRLLPWRSGRWQACFWRPSGPPASRAAGGILPPITCAQWTTREPGLLARLPSNRAR